MKRVLIAGDSAFAETWKKAEKKAVQATVTSPPYNVGAKYDQHNDRMTHGEYFEMLYSAMKWPLNHFCPIAWVNLRPNRLEPFLPWDAIRAICEDRGNDGAWEGWFWQIQNQITWVTSATVPDGNGPDGFSFGHFRPTNSKAILHNGFEWVFQLHSQGGGADLPLVCNLDKLAVGVPYADKSNLKRFGKFPADQDHQCKINENGLAQCMVCGQAEGELFPETCPGPKEGRPDKRCRGNVWCLPYETIQGRQGHPCPFPVSVPERCLKMSFLKPGDLVADPFCGSGSTGVACVRLGLDFVGVDVSIAYLLDARERMEAEGERLGVDVEVEIR